MKYHWRNIVSHESSYVDKASEQIFDWLKNLAGHFVNKRPFTLGHTWLGSSIFVRIRWFHMIRTLKHTNFLTG